MHKYSCNKDSRDLISVILLLFCAFLAFMISKLIEVLLGNVGVIWEFFIFAIGFGPSTYWMIMTNHCSKLLLRLSGMQDCSGIYDGSSKSSYDNYENERSIRLEIRQRFREMEIIYLADHTKSFSKTASMSIEGERTEITYTYVNNGSFEQGLNEHAGTCIITIENGVINGYYYTHPSRKSYGEFTATLTVEGNSKPKESEITCNIS